MRQPWPSLGCWARGKRNVKSDRLRWPALVSTIEDTRNAYRILAGKQPEACSIGDNIEKYLM
jgi:hypothetical protein